MADSGLTATGFLAEVLTDIETSLQRDLRSLIDDGIDLDAQSVYGQLTGIFSERFADLWDALEQVYSSWDPSSATSAALDVLCAITGTIRGIATPSRVVGTFTGTAATTIPAGSIAAAGATGPQFALVEDLVLDGAGNGTGALICTVNGPTVCLSGTLTTIITPVFGWSTITNASDASVGADIDTDAKLRVKRTQQLSKQGSGSVEALRARIRDIFGVVTCSVFDNDTDATDINGIPPHSFEALVGTDDDFTVQDLLDIIWANKPAGIRSYGGHSGTVTDSQGNTQTVSYSTPTEKPVYLILNVLADAATFNSSSGPTDIKAAAVAYALTAYVMGKDVVANGLTAQAFKVSGVLDAPALISFAPTPTLSTTLAVGLREFASLDSANITVNVSYGTP